MSEKKFKVYKSSAGSGKTFTLVKEFLKLCLSSNKPYYYSNILAITFTNKASSEMKDRLITTLKSANDEESLEKNTLLRTCREELDMEVPQFLSRAQSLLSHLLHNYADLSISTIDKFMLKVIKSFSRDLKLPLNFEVELQQDHLLERVISRLLSRIGEDGSADKLMIDYAKWKINEGKSWKLEQDLMNSASTLYKEGGEAKLSELKDVTFANYLSLIASYLSSNLQFEAKAQRIAKEVLSELQKYNVEPLELKGKSRGVGNYFLKVVDGKITLPSNTIQNSIESSDLRSGSNRELNDRIAAVTPYVCDRFDELMQLFDSEFELYNSRKALLSNLPTQSLLAKINTDIEQLKNEENFINISDFNRLISEIVLNDVMPFIYERIGEYFKHIMIDEFQDTSIVQFQNLLPLIENSLANGNESLLVGDAKQSIYRFRAAEVEQFVQLPNITLDQFDELSLERLESLQRNYEEEKLNINRRSAAEIIAFNNDFFDRVIGLDSVSTRSKAIFEGHKQEIPDSATKDGYVEIQLVDGSKKEDRDVIYLEKLLSTVNDLIEEGFSYSDIAILCIKNEPLTTIGDFLTEKGIPVISADAIKLRSSNKVSFLIDLLTLVYDPLNEQAQLHVFHFLFENKWFNSYKEELLQKYIAKGGLGLHKLLLDQSIPLPRKKKSHENLLQWFEKQIRNFKLDSDFDPFLQFFEEYVFDGLSENHGVEEFLGKWDLDKEILSLDLSDKGNAIELMTIHKSKGLEFPVVLLPMAEYDIKSRSSSLWVNNLPPPAFEEGINVGLVNYGSSLNATNFEEVYQEEKIKREGDLLNSIYVAFTRAEKRLYIHSTNSSGESLKLPNMLPLVCDHMNEKDGLFYRGEKIKPTSKKEESKENQIQEKILSAYHSSAWNSKVSLSLEMNTQWKESELDSKAYGSLIHEIMAGIRIEEDLPKVLEDYYLQGKLDLKTKEDLMIQLIQLMNKLEVKTFFEPKLKIRTERSFISENGEVLRPDRIVESENEMRILDYKSGEERKEHKDQVLLYKSELEKISKKKVSAYLLYLQSGELQKVA